MGASATTVNEYMAALEGDAHAIAQQVRQTIHRAAPGMDETVRYKMPCFSIDGEYLVYLGAWKKHIGLYPIPTFDGDLERDVAPYRAATDTARFPYNKTIPYDLVERIVVALVDRIRGRAHSEAQATPQSEAAVCGSGLARGQRIRVGEAASRLRVEQAVAHFEPGTETRAAQEVVSRPVPQR